MRYRRSKAKGGTFVFTVVTFNQINILTKPANVALLRTAFKSVMKSHPFKIDAFVLLPDHLHCIWTLSPDDCDFSTRWRLIKSYLSRECKDVCWCQTHSSRMNKAEKAVWQRRFWEHQIRDDRDFTTHLEYIHYNPVRHKLVTSAKDWPYSSFHRYVKEGKYSAEWGMRREMSFNNRCYGE